jgi:hypothetical protein
VRVQGIVRYEGEPLPRGSIQFAAVAGTDSGSAAINDGGGFVIWLRPGAYRAAVIAYDGIERVDAGGAPLPQLPIIPERYFTPQASGLETTVDTRSRSVAFDLHR